MVAKLYTVKSHMHSKISAEVTRLSASQTIDNLSSKIIRDQVLTHSIYRIIQKLFEIRFSIVLTGNRHVRVFEQNFAISKSLLFSFIIASEP